MYQRNFSDTSKIMSFNNQKFTDGSYVVLMYSSDLSYNQTYSMRQISEMCTK